MWACEVIFYFFIPVDTEKKLVLLTLYGRHTHPPSPPSKAPTIVLKEITELISKINNPGLTRSKYSSYHLVYNTILTYFRCFLKEPSSS